MLFDLSSTPSIAQTYIAELRDRSVQKDRMRFRENLRRISRVLAYELSKHLQYIQAEVNTPLGTASFQKLTQQPIVGTILRAGLPMHEGLLDVFDQADTAFVSAYRKHAADGGFAIAVEYLSCASPLNRVLVLADPMLATGRSMLMAVEAIQRLGAAAEIHLVLAIAAQPGVEFVQKHIPNAHLWIGAIDATLDAHSYIVPGLGDAGDLAFGNKAQH